MTTALFSQLPVDPSKYSGFLVAMFLLAITPGPANLFCISTGLGRSVPKALMGVFGINVATLVWFTAAAFGLHLLITTVPALFHVMTVGGALYLLWIAYKTIRSRKSHSAHELDLPDSAVTQASHDLWQTFRDGFMVQFLNPKVTLFFTAILPPFLDLSRPMVLQMPVYAATAVVLDVIGMTTYGLSGLALTRFLSRGKNRERFETGIGVLLAVIAMLILWHTLSGLIG